MKKILIINSINLYPATMMSQIRALNQIFSLAESKDLKVDVMTFYKNENQRKLSEEKFRNRINKFYNLPSINHDGNWIQRKIVNLKIHLKYYLLGIRHDVTKNSSKYYVNTITKIINKEQYDVVISHYWFGSFFLRGKLNNNTIKIIDIHALVEEDIALNENDLFFTNNKRLEKKKLKNSLKYQKELFKYVDYVIPNAVSQVHILKKNYPEIPYFYCPNGQDLSDFRVSESYDTDTVLFYGSLSSKQNISAFELFYKNVWPIICEKNSHAKLLIVGNNPPEWMKDLTIQSNITVTGYVDNISEYISKTCCFILPMNLGVGFRGRVIEVMATGVPVIGNHNALDCIGLEHGKNGFVTDNYEEMANYALRLMSDKEFRKRLSDNTIEFAFENYTIERTFGKLGEFILSH